VSVLVAVCLLSELWTEGSGSKVSIGQEQLQCFVFVCVEKQACVSFYGNSLGDHNFTAVSVHVVVSPGAGPRLGVDIILHVHCGQIFRLDLSPHCTRCRRKPHFAHRCKVAK
jgi:hypothetical protein